MHLECNYKCKDQLSSRYLGGPGSQVDALSPNLQHKKYQHRLKLKAMTLHRPEELPQGLHGLILGLLSKSIWLRDLGLNWQIYIYIYTCVCIYIYTHIHICIYIIYVYMCVVY